MGHRSELLGIADVAELRTHAKKSLHSFRIGNSGTNWTWTQDDYSRARGDRRPVRRSRNPKAFGWFGGPGIDGAQLMDRLELRPGRRNAMAAAVAETAGGTRLALGALTPLACSLITGTM